MWDGAYKRTIAANLRVAHEVVAVGFFSNIYLIYWKIPAKWGGEGRVLFNDVLLFTVIWRQTYGNGPFR